MPLGAGVTEPPGTRPRQTGPLARMPAARPDRYRRGSRRPAASRSPARPRSRPSGNRGPLPRHGARITGVMQRVPSAITPLTAVAEPDDETGWARSARRANDLDRHVQDAWWVRTTSEPWAHSLPTTAAVRARGRLVITGAGRSLQVRAGRPRSHRTIAAALAVSFIVAAVGTGGIRTKASARIGRACRSVHCWQAGPGEQPEAGPSRSWARRWRSRIYRARNWAEVEQPRARESRDIPRDYRPLKRGTCGTSKDGRKVRPSAWDGGCADQFGRHEDKEVNVM